MKVIWFEIFTVGLIIGFLIAFLLSLAVKWELVHRFDWWMKDRCSRIRFCFYCVSFWMSFAFSFAYAFSIANAARWEYLFMIPIATMIGVHVKLPYQS